MSHRKDMEEIYRTQTSVGFRWTPKRLVVSDNPGACLPSPEIKAMDDTWYIRLYPRGRTQGQVQLADLDLVRCGSPKVVWFTLIVHLEGRIEQTIVSGQRYPDHGHTFYVGTQLQASQIISSSFFSTFRGNLTITCKLWTKEQEPSTDLRFLPHSTVVNQPTTVKPTVSRNGGAGRPFKRTFYVDTESKNRVSPLHLAAQVSEPLCWKPLVPEKEWISRETQTEELPARKENCEDLNTKVDSTLHKHLKHLLLSGDDHDVTLKVKDQEFKAHKCMLRTRSPVFEAMFKHEMRESASDSVSIDDCDPEAFGEFLNYVYTGKVEELSPEKATELYYAGDKYDFPELKEVCLQYLEASLSTTSICHVIALALKHGENSLLESASNFFSRNVKNILPTVEWQRFAAKNLTAANELFLKAIETLEEEKK